MNVAPLAFLGEINMSRSQFGHRPAAMVWSQVRCASAV